MPLSGADNGITGVDELVATPKSSTDLVVNLDTFTPLNLSLGILYIVYLYIKWYVDDSSYSLLNYFPR